MTTTIRTKIRAALLLLILLVLILAGAGLYSARLYQQQVRDVAWRADVLPVASQMNRHVSGLLSTYYTLRVIRQTRQRLAPSILSPSNITGFTGDEFRRPLEDEFERKLTGLKQSYEDYRKLLENRIEEIGIEENFEQEVSTANDIGAAIEKLDEAVMHEKWSAGDMDSVQNVEALLTNLQRHTDRLPNYLADELNLYSQTMRRHSGWLQMTVIICVTVSVGLMILLVHLTYLWIFKPLHILVEGSRQVASGKYSTRIVLATNDEIGELADAMNFMTVQFEEQVRQLEESRRDLDEKVKQKSRELVQSERLASVGFLAAGVAHEINNPLMAISACAESLQRRSEQADDKRYLTMIQEEAFRCKGITERLLGLARKETKERTNTDFVPIVADMLEMLRQQDAFKQKNITLDLPDSLDITVNAQEMKQVVLNLLTNAFQNTDKTGQVMIRLYEQNNVAVLSIQDDGAGMDAEVRQNIFEPFFTRQRGGGGTGLGLSITHRIVEEHQGRMTAFSEGVGKGSTFTVELPMESRSTG
jgi:signal transduction histidine kinase